MPRDKTNKVTSKPSENLNQHKPSPSLIEVFSVRLKIPLGLSSLVHSEGSIRPDGWLC